MALARQHLLAARLQALGAKGWNELPAGPLWRLADASWNAVASGRVGADFTWSLSQSRQQHTAVLHEELERGSAASTSGRGSELHRHHTTKKPQVIAAASGPLSKYMAGRQSGMYREDPRQELTIHMLQELYDDLGKALSPHSGRAGRGGTRRRPSGLTMVDHIDASSDSDAGLSWWSGLKSMVAGSKHGGSSGGPELLGPGVKGLYMYGGVGVGKTMLMDLFVETCPPHFKVMRTHFHDFMLDVHASLRRYEGSTDPLAKVADGIAARDHVLALDEFFVTDVANAVILNRLFSRLWERGITLVSTSNRHPDELYKGGLQRDLFLPFIHKLKTHCRVHDMASTTDYRKLAQHHRGLYFISSPTASSTTSNSSTTSSSSTISASKSGSGSGGSSLTQVPSAEQELRARFNEMAGTAAAATAAPARVEVMMGRTLDVPLAAGKVCMFTFDELCNRPVAAADYIALCESYHTLALQGVPVFTAFRRTEAYRFVALIDVMYDHRTRLICSAEALPVDLFKNIITQKEAEENPQLARQADVLVDDNLGFAKDRTISRLTEMQSLEYLLHHARANAPELVLALEEAQQRQQQGQQGQAQQQQAAAATG